MKSIEFGACIFRVMGYWLLFGFFGGFAEAYNLYQKVISDNPEGTATTIVIIFTAPFISLLISLLLIMIPVKLAKYFLPIGDDGSSSVDIGNSTLAISMLTVLGIYIVVLGLGDAAFNLLSLLNYSKHGLTDSFEFDETIAYQLSTSVELILGFFLLFNARRIYSKLMKSDIEVNNA